ncbi:MAG TPA: sugar ABC transporter substrate-binding protein [Herpetosiphonaceae bacterium]
MRTRLGSCLIIAALLMLAACGSPAAPTASDSSPAPSAAASASPAAGTGQSASGQSTTLRIALVDYKDEHKTWLEKEVIPAFQKTHPNVAVEPIYLNWGTLNETYAGYFAAGEGPDILNMGSEFGPEYGDRLLPLNAYLKQWPDLEQYLAAPLEATTWKGELRGLPWLVMPRTYMCRTDLLKEGSVDQVPQTFDQAVAQAKATTVIKDNKLSRAGVWTIGTDLQDWQEYLQFIWAAGGELYTADGKPTFDSEQARTALKFMYDRRRAVLPNETTAALGEAQGSRLATGEVACLWANAWGAPALDDAVWQKIAMGPSPHPEGGKPVVQVFTDWLGVPQYTKQPDLAVEFLKLLGSKENQAKYNEIFGSFSPRKDATIENPIMKQQADLMAQYGRAFADVRVAPKLSEILQAELPLYFQDNQDLETTLKNIQEKYTQALKDAGRL